MHEKPLTQHNTEIGLNAASWSKKPLLREIYTNFYHEIAATLGSSNGKGILELGSGIGAIKTVLPDCITSDIFINPWLDRIENAYDLKFDACSLEGIVLFDVWHHLQYPGLALKEFTRVLKPGGRVILFEPAMGLLGRIVYGCFHHEPLGLTKQIQWSPPLGEKPTLKYYAAQGNCWRMLHQLSFRNHILSSFDIIDTKFFSAWTYIVSGGFSKPQLLPTCTYPALRLLEKVTDKLPLIFATRMLVSLQRR